jgi:dihydrofolate synthase/folylpolyglutamate synthase
VVRLARELRPLAESMAQNTELGHPTFFELVTAMAFKYFTEQGVQIAVIEVGIGGGLDATNVIHSLVSVITNVSLEHTEVLGRTVLEIAREKAGIIKSHSVLITATGDEEVFSLFGEISGRLNTRVFRVGTNIKYWKTGSSLEGQHFRLKSLLNSFDDLFITLLGDHQLENAACAVGAIEGLSFYGISVDKKAIENGLADARWSGRMEVMQRQPLVLLDCAKDLMAARALKETLLKEFTYDRLIVVVSISSDKNVPAMIDQLAQIADFFVITAHEVMGRAVSPAVIAGVVQKHSKPFEIMTDVKTAVRRAIDLAQQDDMVCVTGSVFLVGEAREIWIKPSNPDI